MAGIDLEAVAFRYEDMQMRFDLHVEDGECLAVIGPSSARQPPRASARSKRICMSS